ncbi:aspartate aminotransferase family protein [Kitasatospora sp. NPDC094011]|uniref:aspartate aminotransferase family protein n=1 Tax=Kitasatospora sp. NPDC094011 TaxID=3364090 RepID=UPI003828EBEE
MKAAEIRERQAALAAAPLREPDLQRLEAEHDRFLRRTRASADLGARAVRVLPRGVEHVDPLSYPYPLFMRGGRGSRVTDVDGNEYVDCILAGGALSLGHNDPELNAALLAVVGGRTNFHGYMDEFEVLAAQRIAETFPSVEAVRFTSSGAEANLAAIRMARAHTGRRKVIKFRGAYHGWGDQFMTDLEVPGSGTILAGGVPPEALSNTVLVDQNDLDALEAALTDAGPAGGVAAVICEPLGAESGLVPFDEDFHTRAIELVHHHGALYVFDEVVTGVRAARGGAQTRFGVTPDLTTLGKGLMNGYPSCGAVGGRREVIDTAHIGVPDGRPTTYIGGTLSGNVLSAAAAYHTLGLLGRDGVFEQADAVAADLVTRLNDLFTARGFDFFAYHFGTVVRIELTAPHAVPLRRAADFDEVLRRREILSRYMLPVQNAGVLSRMGRDMLTTAHTTADNDKVVTAYDRLLDLLG